MAEYVLLDSSPLGIACGNPRRSQTAQCLTWIDSLLARGVVLIFCLLMIALIGVSRIDSGEHWASDVGGGFLLGSAFLIVWLSLYQRGRAAVRGRDKPIG